MKALLQRILKYLSYLAAAVVILLAVAVGLFRLLLPRLPAYQEEIKDWANAAIGLRVEFSGMNARWRLSGPELSFRDAALGVPDSGTSLLTAEEVSVGVSLMRLLRDRELVVDHILIRDTGVEIRQDESGSWLVQGMPVEQLIGSRTVSPQQVSNVVLTAEDIDVSLQHPDSGQLLSFVIDSLEITRDNEALGIDAAVDLPEGFGDRLEISATQRNEDAEAGGWQLYVEGDSLELAGWSGLQPVALPAFSSGGANLSLWLEWSDAGIRSVTANVAAYELEAGPTGSQAPFGLQGRVEYSRDADGWLLAANRFRLQTIEGNWPQTTWRLQVDQDGAGSVDGLDASISFLDLDDLVYVTPWLPESQRELVGKLEPSGQLRDLDFGITNLRDNSRRYDVAAELDDVGVAAHDDWPGIRRFSGRVRADTASGLLEIDSVGLTLDLAAQLSSPVEFDDAIGTIIWRRNAAGITVLSDSVQIRNADLDSQISLQVTLPADGTSPLVDLDSNWSFNDIGMVGRYLPEKLIKPTLYRWLTGALIAGNVRRGRTRFVGPLDKFPFDGGEGLFRVDAQVEDATLLYAPDWPAASNIQAEMVMENMRLYSVRNTTMNEGNSVRDARVEIPDLRLPVLHIDAFATGTLESIRSFSQRSPIARLFGGQLDRLEVGGDASFNLLLTYPITDRQNYEFTTRIQMSDGSLRLEGFPAPLTAVNGVVTITRDEVGSESLFGEFLGAPVDIGLTRAAEDESPYGVIATATGTVSAAGLVDGLAPPLAGLIDGATDYRVDIRFPQGNREDPVPLQIGVESELQGLTIAMPAPLAKPSQESKSLSLNIEFPEDGRIESNGTLSEQFRWTAGFRRSEPGWEFDRGVLAVGGIYPSAPEVRGLHIEGQINELTLQEWLDVARRPGSADDGTRPAAGNFVRSLDLVVGNLHALGQQLIDHRVVANRSALDWIIEVSGEQVSGTLTVPYDFAGPRSLVLDMQRLQLPGSDNARPAPEIDPRTLPPIIVSAEEFALGDRHFGSLSADFSRTEVGLETASLATRDPSFSIEGNAGWVIDESDEQGQRSFLNAKLVSNDIEQTMHRLNYQPGLVGDDMEVDLEVSWSGGPRADFLGTLDGTVSVRFGVGQLVEVDPGAGRLFGLMSVVALPRRLSLDFGDVFDKGFGFDTISGVFRIVNGEAYTCDLSLSGPAADVGIVGRAGLVARDYNQTAIVSTNVGNTLPVMGLVAGPQVAAALLIFSQIFKKPLQEMGQIYYGIEGSWDEPSIEVATAVRFAATSGLAGCIEATE